MTMVSETRLTRWDSTTRPDSQTLHEALQAEELSILEWTDQPGTIYPVHTHPFPEVRVVVTGRLRIGLPETGEEIILTPGDRMDVPAETPHWEDVVGSEPTTYFAATRTVRHENGLTHNGAKPSGNGK